MGQVRSAPKLLKTWWAHKDSNLGPAEGAQRIVGVLPLTRYSPFVDRA
jgi:hypothetical protein